MNDLNIKNKPEILAPAGSFESLVAGIRAGANAIYLGMSNFSARNSAQNFSEEELEKAVFYAHKCGVKIYLAINTLLFDNELELVKKQMIFAGKCGVDAFIIQDLSVFELAKKMFPNMPLHASTQMSIHTKEGILYAKQLGFSRVVLSRELSKKHIQELSNLGIEIEVFVHGALCFSMSGQCLMSALIGSRSANRGRCAQPCRLPFSAEKCTNENILSLKDLSYLKEIEELNCVTSLKIEGRMKRPEYVFSSVMACKDALNGKIPDIFTLQSVFSRDGFTDGYFYNNYSSEMFGIRQKEDVLAGKMVLPEIKNAYRKEVKFAQISLNLFVQNGEKVTLSAEDELGNKATVEGDFPETAINRPLSVENAEKHLSKLGDTIYTVGKISVKIDEMLTVSASILNDLRRRVCDELDKKRVDFFTKKHEIYNDVPLQKIPNKKPTLNKKLRLDVCHFEQISDLNLCKIDKIILPLSEYINVPNDFAKEKIILKLPRFTYSEELMVKEIENAKNSGFTAVLATNFAHIKIANDLNLDVYSGASLNITNSISAKKMAEMGVKELVLSYELTLDKIAKISSEIPLGIVGYGQIPLMISAVCPLKYNSKDGCKSCNHKLQDRTKRFFKLKCSKIPYDNGVEILNCDTLYLADRMNEINVDFVILSFIDEKSDEIQKIINAYENGYSPEKIAFTRGLYYRGVE